MLVDDDDENEKKYITTTRKKFWKPTATEQWSQRKKIVYV